jgi:AbrB family looped-hinge helix DNA binding protein
VVVGEASKVGKRGAVVIPAKLRKKYGFTEGSSILFEDGPGGVVIRPAVTVPVGIWSPERKAGFLLENAVDAADYERARDEVREMGLDPDRIPHGRPGS